MFKGSMPALVTPFTDDGAVDEKAFAEHVDWQITEGTIGLVPVGTTGESPTLSHAEHKRVVELCIEVAARRVPVIAGAGSNNTVEAIDLARMPKRPAPMRCSWSRPITTSRPRRACLRAFRRRSPRRSRCRSSSTIFPARSVDRHERRRPWRSSPASDYANIVGVKDATGKIERVSEQRMACGKRFHPAVRRGCHRARLQRPWRRRLHLGDGQCRAAPLCRIPGADSEGRLTPLRWNIRTG